MSRYTLSEYYQETRFPIDLHIERRNGVRVAFGARALIIRLPNYFNQTKKKEKYEWCIDWAKKTLSKNDAWLRQFKPLLLENNELKVLGRIYHITMIPQQRKTVSTRVEGLKLLIKYPNDASDMLLFPVIRKGLHRGLAHSFAPEIETLVSEINQKYYRFRYKQVKLNYVQSKWGSCNSKGNLVFNTKLLLCPLDKVRYVIIHELAHLKHMNHSKAFWSLVGQACPDYMVHDRWLDTDGVKVGF